MFEQAQKRSQRKPAAKTNRLHSIAGMLRDRSFEGNFDVDGVNYSFRYAPDKAAVISDKLELSGNMTVKDGRPNPRVSPHEIRNMRATLLATQGGIGTAPPRKTLPAEISEPRPELPIVESTGSLSFCGVLYLKLQPVQGSSLGVPADMTRVQMNIRLAPVSDVERGLQAAFSWVADALYGKKVDRAAAESAISDLNRFLTT
jgi:hypothetical protein